MIDHTSPVGDVSTISTHLYKIGFLNIKEDLVKGERSAERGWKKYRVVVKGFFMELYKATKQNEPVKVKLIKGSQRRTDTIDQFG